MTKQELFFSKYSDSAMETQNLFGVPASITLAQGALESRWAESGLTTRSNNFFGIKADKSWKGAVDIANTKEFVNGAYITISSGFRKYNSAKDSFFDHAKFLRDNKRYANLFNNLNYKEWAVEIKQDGYATDPQYATKLIGLIELYDLAKYDSLAPKKKP